MSVVCCSKDKQRWPCRSHLDWDTGSPASFFGSIKNILWLSRRIFQKYSPTCRWYRQCTRRETQCSSSQVGLQDSCKPVLLWKSPDLSLKLWSPDQGSLPPPEIIPHLFFETTQRREPFYRLDLCWMEREWWNLLIGGVHDALVDGGHHRLTDCASHKVAWRGSFNVSRGWVIDRALLNSWIDLSRETMFYGAGDPTFCLLDSKGGCT